jgi:hypothetical protein
MEKQSIFTLFVSAYRDRIKRKQKGILGLNFNQQQRTGPNDGRRVVYHFLPLVYG